MKKKEEDSIQLSLFNLDELPRNSKKSKKSSLESKSKKKEKMNLPELKVKDIVNLIDEGYSFRHLRFVSSVEGKDNQDLEALCEFDKKRISFNTNYPLTSEKINSVIHEIYHGVAFEKLKIYPQQKIENDIIKSSGKICTQIYTPHLDKKRMPREMPYSEDISELTSQDIFEIISKGFSVQTLEFVVPLGIPEEPVICRSDTREILINSNLCYRDSKKFHILQGFYTAKCLINDTSIDAEKIYQASKKHYKKEYHRKINFPDEEK